MTAPAKIYDSITELILSKFIDCLVNENLYALVISGDPVKEELQAAWNNILVEYNDALGDAETKMYATILKELTTLKATIKQIEIALHVLRLPYYDEDYARDLNLFNRTKFAFDISNPEQYYSDLDKIEKMSSGIKLRRDLKQIEFDAIQAKAKGDIKKPTKEYFLKALISLTDYSGVRCNADEITVFEFCERMRRFDKYIKDIETKT